MSYDTTRIGGLTTKALLSSTCVASLGMALQYMLDLLNLALLVEPTIPTNALDLGTCSSKLARRTFRVKVRPVHVTCVPSSNYVFFLNFTKVCKSVLEVVRFRITG